MTEWQGYAAFAGYGRGLAALHGAAAGAAAAATAWLAEHSADLTVTRLALPLIDATPPGVQVTLVVEWRARDGAAWGRLRAAAPRPEPILADQEYDAEGAPCDYRR